jgi:hypothetical protein
MWAVAPKEKKIFLKDLEGLDSGLTEVLSPVIADVLYEIRTKRLRNTNLQRYVLNIPLSKTNPELIY